MIDINLNTTILIVIWVVAGVIALAPLVIQTNWKRYLVVPLVFFAIYASFTTNKEFLGTPVYDVPDGEFVYVYHTVAKYNGNKMVTLWIRQTDRQRLFRFPYVKSMKESLRNARKSKLKGKSLKGKFEIKKKNKDLLDDTESHILKIYEFPYQEVYPKG
tara:strand:+ start:338 stop:814 length:477 start_codon:yes stop_codon:yes gene_type:complete